MVSSFDITTLLYLLKSRSAARSKKGEVKDRDKGQARVLIHLKHKFTYLMMEASSILKFLVFRSIVPRNMPLSPGFSLPSLCLRSNSHSASHYLVLSPTVPPTSETISLSLSSIGVRTLLLELSNRSLRRADSSMRP